MFFGEQRLQDLKKSVIINFPKKYLSILVYLPWSATRSLVQPSSSGCESSAFTAGELCFKRPDKVYIAFARMDTDEEGDGSKKERRVGNGLYERY